jgi:hypothetical protein
MGSWGLCWHPICCHRWALGYYTGTPLAPPMACWIMVPEPPNLLISVAHPVPTRWPILQRRFEHH